MEPIEALVKNCEALASPPEVFTRLNRIANDPTASMDDIAKVVSLDAAITARILKIVNSPFYGLKGKIGSITHAVSILGVGTIQDLVLASSVMTTASARMVQKEIDLYLFWRNSVFCGLLARALAKQCKLSDDERLFVRGLLREVGHLVMYEKIPQLARAALQRAQEEGEPLFRVERDMIGFDYAEVGNCLMREWNVPLSIQEVIRYHTEPSKTQHFQLEASIVHVAAVITEWLLASVHGKEWPAFVEKEAWEATKLADHCLNPVIEEAEEQVTRVLKLIYPSPKKQM